MTILFYPTLDVYFFRTDRGNEPVREWLKELSYDDKKTIGTEIKTVQFGWPMGMPLVRKLTKQIWEIRISLTGKRIARILFTLDDNRLVLVHGFIKKSQKTPQQAIDKAEQRAKQYFGQ